MNGIRLTLRGWAVLGALCAVALGVTTPWEHIAGTPAHAACAQHPTAAPCR